MKNYEDFDDSEYEEDDSEYEEDTLEDLIEYVLEYLDPTFIYKDFVVDRLANLEGEYERTDAAVTYFKRTDLDKTKWKFCYNLIIPVVIPPEEYFGEEDYDKDESMIVKTLMLDIIRNPKMIEEDKPRLDGDNVSSETIEIDGFEVFWMGIPQIKVSAS